MKKLLIILLLVCLFIYGCNYKPLNPISSDVSNINQNSKVMYFKFKVSGKSSNKKFKVLNEDIYPREVSIENYYNNMTYTYTGKWGDKGYVAIYYFCDDKIGNSMSIPFYVGDSKLQAVYNDKNTNVTFNGYIWILNSGKGFCRNNFSVTIPITNFDEDKYNNTALISIVLYPDNDTYKCTFDGFETK